MPSLDNSEISSTAECGLPPLQAYAKHISLAAETISNYCASNNIPHPSFDPGAPSVTIPSSAPLHVLDARQKLVASAAKVQQLSTEPGEYLPNLAIHVRSPLSFHFTQIRARPYQWICFFKLRA